MSLHTFILSKLCGKNIIYKISINYHNKEYIETLLNIFMISSMIINLKLLAIKLRYNNNNHDFFILLRFSFHLFYVICDRWGTRAAQVLYNIAFLSVGN